MPTSLETVLSWRPGSGADQLMSGVAQACAQIILLYLLLFYFPDLFFWRSCSSDRLTVTVEPCEQTRLFFKNQMVLKVAFLTRTTLVSFLPLHDCRGTRHVFIRLVIHCCHEKTHIGHYSTLSHQSIWNKSCTFAGNDSHQLITIRFVVVWNWLLSSGPCLICVSCHHFSFQSHPNPLFIKFIFLYFFGGGGDLALPTLYLLYFCHKLLPNSIVQSSVCL